MSRQAPQNPFLNEPNFKKIIGFLRHHYTTKLGTQALPERMETRIQTTVQHYMKEVARVGPPGKQVGQLNQEVVREATSSLDTWIRKQESATPPTTTSVGAFSRPDEYVRLFEDTNTRYETLMADRTAPPPVVPPAPDFRKSQDMIAESNEDPVLLMQRLQKQREEQARAIGLAGPPPSGPRLEIKEDLAPSAGNPVPPQAEAPPALLAPRPQDYIIPQENIVKYRETEINLFITSADRDWLRNTSENRYNFTVNFNTGSKKQGFGFNTSIQTRLRNIQRVEFVKAILPTESLTTLVKVTNDSPTYDTTRVINVFSLPFIGIRIDELETNGYSTNPQEDATFAIIQYDTTWNSDHTSQASNGVSSAPVLTRSGYTGFIPKFLKTQKVYTPTPLATLQKLSIQVQRHTGDVLSTQSDVLFFQRICLSSAFTTIGGGSPLYGDIGAASQNSYSFLQTSKYFPFSAVGEGDLIQIQGYVPTTTSVAGTDYKTWLTNATGHYVVATAYVNTFGILVDGRNNAGYCNVIIIRNRFDDPSTGSTGRSDSYYGGSSSSETTFAGALDNTTSEPNQVGAALINLSRQTHMVLRVVTRDMDSGSNIRPDNV